MSVTDEKTIEGKVDEYETDRLDAGKDPVHWMLRKIAELELRLEHVEDEDLTRVECRLNNLEGV